MYRYAFDILKVLSLPFFRISDFEKEQANATTRTRKVERDKYKLQNLFPNPL